MMKLRIAALGIAALALATAVSPALAGPMVPVALVEEVSGAPAGVEFMDYVATGKTIQLGTRGSIVLSYLGSCVRETITGGTVTVGADQSEVQGGRVLRSKVPCDAAKLALGGDRPGQFAGRVVRSVTSAVESKLTLYGRSPILELKGPCTLLIERLDQASERYLVDVASDHLVRGSFYDFAKWGRQLAAGGLYRISLENDGGQEVVFDIDAHAKPGNTPVLGRLLRLSFPK
ncbi:MAG TPA: hypothetical protein VH678_07440 [Xanthobacteraceae bacterium]|jgi:hypothetical protein